MLDISKTGVACKGINKIYNIEYYCVVLNVRMCATERVNTEKCWLRGALSSRGLF